MRNPLVPSERLSVLSSTTTATNTKWNKLKIDRNDKESISGK